MKQLFLTHLAACALAACTENKLTAVEDDFDASDNTAADAEYAKLPVKAAARTAPAIDTRTPYMGKPAADNPFYARVIAYQGDAVSGGQGAVDFNATPYRNGFINFIGNTTTPFTEPLYYNRNEKLSLLGFYPARYWTEQGSSIAFDGSMDVMVAPTVVSDRADAKAGRYPTLTFRHLLTNLVVSVKGDNRYWGDIIGIKLSAAGDDQNAKPINIIEYDKATQTPTYKATRALTTGSTDLINDEGDRLDRIEGLSFFKVVFDSTRNYNVYSDQKVNLAAEPMPITPDKQYLGYSIVQPITPGDPTDNSIAHQNYYLTVYTTQGPGATGCTVKIPTLVENDNTTPYYGDTTGRGFGVLLNFSADEVFVTTVAIPWNEHGTIIVDVPDNNADLLLEQHGGIAPYNDPAGTTADPSTITY